MSPSAAGAIMPPSGATVFVLDDDLSVREALRSLIRSVGLRCETFATAAEFLRHPRADEPACLVLDVHLSSGISLDLPTELRQHGAQLPIIFITGQGTIPMSVRAMKAGALEFLTKPFSEQELLDAIRQALVRDGEARALRAEQHALHERLAKLTMRERDVFALVVAGRMNKEIAAELGTAEQTIKQHRGRVMQKLGVRSVADLVHLAERLTPAE
jgi:FixJ family two-component response regulator